MSVCVLPVFSADWRQITEKSYVDFDSVKATSDRSGKSDDVAFIFWIKDLNDGSDYFKDMEKYYNKKIWYVLDQHIVNCTQKTIATRSSTRYDLKSQVIDTKDNRYYETHDIIPDSLGDLYYEVICEP